jgi:hypothetical protein
MYGPLFEVFWICSVFHRQSSVRTCRPTDSIHPGPSKGGPRERQKFASSQAFILESRYIAEMLATREFSADQPSIEQNS